MLRQRALIKHNIRKSTKKIQALGSARVCNSNAFAALNASVADAHVLRAFMIKLVPFGKP
jgi:hypothetical protein